MIWTFGRPACPSVIPLISVTEVCRWLFKPLTQQLPLHLAATHWACAQYVLCCDFVIDADFALTCLLVATCMVWPGLATG